MVFRAGSRDPCTRDVARFSESVKIHEPQASVFLRFPKIEQHPKCSDPNARIIIGGDINKLNVTELITQHSLQQMVKSPTRGERILDVFLTNYPLLWRKPIVFNSLVRSDHRGVLISPRITIKPVRKNVIFRDVHEHRKVQMDRKLQDLE